MKLKSGFLVLFTAMLCGVSLAAHAIEREDVLECGLADGSKFILRSKYEYSLIPLPLGHQSRESNRRGWNGDYRDASGKLSHVPASVHYSNKEPNVLVNVCAHFGMRKGVPLAAFTYLRNDGTWLPKDNFPWRKLDVNVGKIPDQLSAEQHSQMEQAGIKRSAFAFAYILPANGRLVYEQPLHRAYAGYVYDLTFDAVYQSFSDDGGKTWSDPVVTTKAEIFEIGKSWVEQSFRARPIKLNGQSIQADFPLSDASPK